MVGFVGWGWIQGYPADYPSRVSLGKELVRFNDADPQSLRRDLDSKFFIQDNDGNDYDDDQGHVSWTTSS